jgi:hypothetical protein
LWRNIPMTLIEPEKGFSGKAVQPSMSEIADFTLRDCSRATTISCGKCDV